MRKVTNFFGCVWMLVKMIIGLIRNRQSNMMCDCLCERMIKTFFFLFTVFLKCKNDTPTSCLGIQLPDTADEVTVAGFKRNFSAGTLTSTPAHAHVPEFRNTAEGLFITYSNNKSAFIFIQCYRFLLSSILSCRQCCISIAVVCGQSSGYRFRPTSQHEKGDHFKWSKQCCGNWL